MLEKNENIINSIVKEIKKKVVGQDKLIRDLLITILSKGHILLEGPPGLAKTLSVKTLSEVLDLDFNRIQFTPDLLPSDLIGSKIYRKELDDFYIKKGPLFSNFVLADEINRAPSKVQSALLEAMEERQITIGEETISLADPFVVLATQNPIEQEGTYSLPEAQLDRFLLKTIISYPTEAEELAIMKLKTRENIVEIQKILDKNKIKKLSEKVEKIDVEDKIYEYVKDIIFKSRSKSENKYILFGASPRAGIALIKTAKALAFLNGRDFVLPEDIKEMAFPVLRHRLILTYEAIADDITTDNVIKNILKTIKII